jgi:hypothetical protein
MYRRADNSRMKREKYYNKLEEKFVGKYFSSKTVIDENDLRIHRDK